MPVRIYALAKELKVDSKDLAEICKKVGLAGKGSALASLDDDEVQRVKDHLAAAEARKQASQTAEKKPAPIAPPARRPAILTPSRPQRTDPVRRANTPIGKRKSPAEEAAAEEAAAEEAAAEEAAAEEAAAVEAGSSGTATPEADLRKAVASGQGSDGPTAERTSAEAAAKSEQTAPRADAPKPSNPSKAAAPAGKSAPLSAGKLSVGRGGDGPPPTGSRPSSPASGGGKSAPGRSETAADASTSQRSKSDGDSGKRSTETREAAASGSPAAASPTSPTRAPVRGGVFGAGGGGKIRVIGRGGGEPRSTGSKEKETPKDTGGKPTKRRGPVINLAAMPEAKQPVAKPAANEPPAQKPEIRLSKDVIAGHKQGVKAPLEALQAQEQQKDGGKSSGKGGLSSFTGTEKGRGRGRGPAAPVAPVGREEEEKGRKGLAGMASARAVRGNKGRRRSNQRQDIEHSLSRDDNRRRRTLTRKGTNTAAPRKEKVVLELPCSLRSFSEAAGVPVAQVLRVLMGMGVMANINASIDQETAELVATELDLDIELKAQETLEDELISQIESTEDSDEELIPRAPIVTFLGHVDHGKTSLLDALIGIEVAKGEAGGITQHIRAYQVGEGDRRVTFVDTPGHEAFTEMRARGANVTDIAVLVIAADDGIMPQTEEAISHAKAAEVPIVVALNKIDLEGVDATRAMTQMTEHGLTPSEWGGDVEVVRTSALTGQGMDELLETLLTIAELNEYRANPNRDGIGVCLEAEQQGDRGVITKLVVRNGTLRVGDIIVCGGSHGRVRAMHDPLTGKPLASAGPSTPVSIIGLDKPPGPGDRFHVLSDIGQAREIAAGREESSRNEALSGITTKVSFENFQTMMEEGRLGEVQDRVRLNLIIRADARGSLEAIDKELSKIDHPEVDIRILQRSVGGITVADVTLASASEAVVLGFNVIPDEAARALADQRGVEMRRYSVIYKLTDEIKAILEGRLRPEERVVELGRALVKQVFQISRSGTIAGSYVAQGVIERGCRIRVNRDGRTIGDYALDSVRRVKEDVKEVPRGMECGIKLAGFNDIRQDDVLEAYKIEEVARTLD